MRNRQINLDFHTSEHIEGIGSNFSKSNFQKALILGRVNSITLFAKCHHGWAYHKSAVNKMHPHLDFDLLAAQIEAAHEIGVKTPVYLSAGLDERAAREHKEWRFWGEEDYRENRYPTLESVGFHSVCFNSGYVDYLMAEIEEICKNYEPDGIFLDIVRPSACLCPKCRAELEAQGGTVGNAADMEKFGEQVYERYYRRARETVDKYKPGLPIFHNAGHVRRGRRDLMAHVSHFEIESLPTGGWGYDNFPITAAYVRNFDKEFLAMTGKFHGTWGEFGGYKHPNALRFETALAVANGAGCSVGDQLHPDGHMDIATYEMIGRAYDWVDACAPVIADGKNVADVAIISSEAAYWHYKVQDFNFEDEGYEQSDYGASRIMLEGHWLYDVVDFDSDLTRYKLVILPDRIRVDDALAGKLRDYLAHGGKLLMSGTSGLLKDGDKFFTDFGAEFLGESEFSPVYTAPEFEFGQIRKTSYVTYAPAYNVTADADITLAWRENPYFNRTAEHFCSHQHAPNVKQPAGSAVVLSRAESEFDKNDNLLSKNNNIAYIAANIFEEYAKKGCFFAKQLVQYTMSQLIGDTKLTEVDLPSQGICTLMQKPESMLLHLLFAPIVKRGENTELIDDIIVLRDINCAVRAVKPVREVVLMPQNVNIDFACEDGMVKFVVPKIDCHQMVEIKWRKDQ